nr:DUF427 domain-containing protein [Pyrinomonadaceae bacterium]
MKATWNNVNIAESDETIVVEGNHYFPPETINKDYFQESSGGIVASMVEEDLLVTVIPGMIMLFIGLALILNGLMFTLPRKQLREHAEEAQAQKTLDLNMKTA